MIVQYNKFEFNDAQYGPYPAKVSSNRITNESATPQVKTPSPLLTRPNEIGEAAWQNWVQERGLYFLADDKDSRYHDVLEFDDDFTYQQRAEDRRPGRDHLRQGPLGLRRAWLVAAAAIGHRWRVSAAGEPDFARAKNSTFRLSDLGLRNTIRNQSEI